MLAWHVSITKKISLYLPVHGKAVREFFGVLYTTIRTAAAPLLLPHLFERIGNVERADLLTVLEFQELIPAVACHVDEYI